jgi:peptide deformylase
MSAEQILSHDEGAVTIADAVGVVHVTAEAIEHLEATGQLARVAKLGKGRIGVVPQRAAPTGWKGREVHSLTLDEAAQARANGLDPNAPEYLPPELRKPAMGVLDALDTLAGPRQFSTASRANPLHLLYYGDPLLTGERSVELAADGALPLQVIDAMRRALAATGGLGISGVHVGAPVRLCIVPNGGKRTIMVNPRILKHGRIRTGSQEGSLSVPGFHCQIIRWNHVTVEYFDGDTNPRVRTVARLEKLEARILQHQLDAMEGRIVPDGLTRQQKRQCQRIGDAARRTR